MDYKETLNLILQREYIDPKFFHGLSSYFFPNEIINIIRCQTIRIEQDKLENRKRKKIDIKYTQINSRSAQHFNISQKMCKLNLSFDDVAKEAEVFYKVNPKKKISSKTEKGTILNAYMFNYCS